MKTKIKKIVIAVILLTILVILITITYFFISEIETSEPKEIDQKYNVKVDQFMNRKIFTIMPREKETSEKVIIYLHGGAYMAEITSEHWDFLSRLIDKTGATIILPDYPLAPKYNYKDVFNILVPLYKEIIDRVDTNNLILMGDSAGGGMSLALAERIGEENLQMPNRTILISPWLDVRLENPKIEEIEEFDKDLSKEKLIPAGISYAGDSEGLESYLVNPIDGDLSKLQNVTIFTGTYDILNPDVWKLKERADGVGTNIEIKQYEKASHIWIINKNKDDDLVKQAENDLIEVIKN